MMTKKQVWDAKKELEKLLNELPKMSTPELLSYTRMYAETWGVKIEGEVWTARAYDDDEEIEKGKRVHVVEIKGATALVSE